MAHVVSPLEGRLVVIKGESQGEKSVDRSVDQLRLNVSDDHPIYFSGDSLVEFGDWWLAVSEHLELHAVNHDQHKLKYTYSNLTGFSKAWYKCLREKTKHFADRLS